MIGSLYDVIIVGAGPGGSTLGAHLAKQGLKTLLLDKSHFPRYKVCGGGLTLRASKLLDFDISPVTRDQISKIEFSHGGNDVHTLSIEGPFLYMVMRDELDQMLVEFAVDAGVDFRPSHSVQKVQLLEDGVIVSTEKADFRGKIVVGADGVNSIVAKQLGLMSNRNVALALEYEMNVEEHLLEKYKGKVAADYGLIQEGYAWVFPKGDHLSVGIGGSIRDGRFLQGKLAEFMNQKKLDGELTSQKGFFLSIGGKKQPIVKGRGALIGEAAGLVDPFMGEGIYYAILSGKILSEVLLSNWDKKSEPLEGYQIRVQKEILPELKFLKKVSTVFYSFSKQSHKLLINHPHIVERASEVFSGELSFLNFFPGYRQEKGISSFSFRPSKAFSSFGKINDFL